MAPYAATLESPVVLQPCGYLGNIDHERFVAVYRMLQGAPPQAWRWSQALRRPLFEVLALPFVNAFGILAGGLIASIGINVAAFNAFCILVMRRVGKTAAIATIWLLATYPGIPYWAGLPYAYVIIVPGALVSTMLLYRLSETRSAVDLIVCSLSLGIIFLGYDLYAFFGVAALLILLWRRRVAWTAAAAVLMGIPTCALMLVFAIAHIPSFHRVEALYGKLIAAYLHPHDVHMWLHMLADVPMLFVSTFLYSNFVVLPLLFLGAIVVGYQGGIRLLEMPDAAILIAGAAVFLFNNLAPPYSGLQMRGDWIPRIYQAIFPPLVLAIARVSERFGAKGGWAVALAAAVVVNASIAFGPVLKNPIAAEVDYRFFNHLPEQPPRPDALIVNVKKYGRRPIGMCR